MMQKKNRGVQKVRNRKARYERRIEINVCWRMARILGNQDS